MIVNPVIWFANREVSNVPKHFIKCPSPVTEEAQQWILNKSQGRYSFSNVIDEGDIDNDEENVLSWLLYAEPKKFVHFENSEDALMYNLLWSDNK
jgi:hypothetical protein